MKTISNFKRIVMGVVTLALSMAFSSYMIAEKRAEGDLYVHTPSGGNDYVLESSGVYSPTNCFPIDNITCAYRVTEAGASFVTGPFTDEQAQEYLDNGWIEVDPDATDGQYTP